MMNICQFTQESCIRRNCWCFLASLEKTYSIVSREQKYFTETREVYTENGGDGWHVIGGTSNAIKHKRKIDENSNWDACGTTGYK